MDLDGKYHWATSFSWSFSKYPSVTWSSSAAVYNIDITKIIQRLCFPCPLNLDTRAPRSLVCFASNVSHNRMAGRDLRSTGSPRACLWRPLSGLRNPARLTVPSGNHWHSCWRWPYLSGWWFGTFFIFPSIGNNHPNWLIFFRGVVNHQPLIVSFPIEHGDFPISFWS